MAMKHRLIGLALLAWLLAACGGATAPTPTAALPTSTTIPTFAFVEPTAPPQVATAAATLIPATAETVALDPQAVERGRGRYETLECGTCHGPNGEGSDQGSSMVDYTGTEDEFISFMRSGGEVGTDHQYSTNRLSESGGRNLYQYLLSLRP